MASARPYTYRKKGQPASQKKWRLTINPPPGSGLKRREPIAEFPSKKAAERAADALEAQWWEDYVHAGEPTMPTVAEWWETVKADGLWPMSETAVTHRDSDMDNYVIPRWGGLPLDAVRTPEVTGWLNRLVTGPEEGDRLPRYPGWPLTVVGPPTPIHVKATFSMLMTLAVRHGKIDVNRVTAAVAPRAAGRIPRFMLMEDVQAALQHLPEWLRVPILVLALTGLRFEELRGLDDSSWQPGQRRLAVDRVIIEPKARDFAWRPVPKGLRWRHVPVVAALATAIEEHAAKWPPRPQTIRHAVDRDVVKDDVTVTLWFTGPDGGPLRAERVLDMWTAAQAAAGLTRRGVLHSLRHTYASHLLTSGTPIGRLAVLMGHSSTRTTELYGWIQDLDHEEVRRVLDDAATGFLADDTGNDAE